MYLSKNMLTFTLICFTCVANRTINVKESKFEGKQTMTVLATTPTITKSNHPMFKGIVILQGRETLNREGQRLLAEHPMGMIAVSGQDEGVFVYGNDQKGLFKDEFNIDVPDAFLALTPDQLEEPVIKNRYQALLQKIEDVFADRTRFVMGLRTFINTRFALGSDVDGNPIEIRR